MSSWHCQRLCLEFLKLIFIKIIIIIYWWTKFVKQNNNPPCTDHEWYPETVIWISLWIIWMNLEDGSAHTGSENGTLHSWAMFAIPTWRIHLRKPMHCNVWDTNLQHSPEEEAFKGSVTSGTPVKPWFKFKAATAAQTKKVVSLKSSIVIVSPNIIMQVATSCSMVSVLPTHGLLFHSVTTVALESRVWIATSNINWKQLRQQTSKWKPRKSKQGCTFYMWAVAVYLERRYSATIFSNGHVL